jgi:AcrR family transcriptional regulator
VSAGLRDRVLDATFAEVDENGLAGLTVEAVATRAGSSRATIYRHFPGGRDELIETSVRREVDRFFTAVAAVVPAGGDLVDRVAALVSGARALLDEHRVLQRLLEDEAEAIMPSLATVHPQIEDALVTLLRAELRRIDLRPGIDVDVAADHAARMVLSYVGAAGSWDFDDPVAVDEVVRTRILAGIV